MGGWAGSEGGVMVEVGEGVGAVLSIRISMSLTMKEGSEGSEKSKEKKQPSLKTTQMFN